ncbi:hypothetical protein J3R82DRAFT_9453 [Butyriboletus roseoflavus]|nr:hypothetical protein J3R82DRAFT_9453 [Butyriboletus roseoflavus]
MHVSVEASWKKPRTSYIDILYVHWWDWETCIEEVDGFHTLVQQGKVLYLASQYARDRGKTPFVIYQGLWNIMDRSIERAILPIPRSSAHSPMNSSDL